MNSRRVCQLVLAALALTASAAAMARGHVGVGVYIGPGWGPGYYGPGYWGYPRAYYPPVYAYPPVYPGVVMQEQPEYIEQGQQDLAPEQAPAQAASMAPPGQMQGQAQPVWYHCSKPDGYYPYVKNCPGGWQTVPAQPPAGS